MLRIPSKPTDYWIYSKPDRNWQTLSVCTAQQSSSSQLLFLDDCRRGAQWSKGLCNFVWGSLLELGGFLNFFSGIFKVQLSVFKDSIVLKFWYWTFLMFPKSWKDLEKNSNLKIPKIHESSWKILKISYKYPESSEFLGKVPEFSDWDRWEWMILKI